MAGRCEWQGGVRVAFRFLSLFLNSQNNLSDSLSSLSQGIFYNVECTFPDV